MPRLRSCLAALLVAAIGTPIAAQMPAIYVSNLNWLREYDSAGVFLGQVAIPHPSGTHPPTEVARDLVVHPSGDVWIYNGTFAPWLSVRRAATMQWQHFTHPQWATFNNGSYGGIAILGDSVFVTAAQTIAVNGSLLRFDIATSTWTVFATQWPEGFLDVAVGWDGLLYAIRLSERDIEVFDRHTLQHVRSIVLPLATDARGIGVDRHGHLFVATWLQGLLHFDANGVLVAALATGERHHDLDLDCCGNLVFANWAGLAFRSDVTLAAASGFPVGSYNTYVAFRAPNVPAPAAAAVRLGAPANPDVFAGPGARLGTTWTPTLQPFLPGAVFEIVGIGSHAANVPSPFGTVLLDEQSPWFSFDFAGQPLHVPIPDTCWLTGFTFVAQGAAVSWQAIALTNALDVRIGTFD